ncbi:amino acid kinase family protein [Candidatus Vidania fulgoroideorum]
MFEIIVKKFGGEALKSIDNIKNICKIIKNYVLNNKKVIVIASAPKNFTNLLSKISIQNICNIREKDTLLSCGEQISSSLISIILNSLRIKAISLQGWQVPFFCSKKKIVYVYKSKLKKILKEYNVVVISGFQGINKNGDIVTFERGGSDTSAAYISNIFNTKCYFYKDTSGVYQADPKILKLKRIKKIFIEDMLEISSSGAKILSLDAVTNIFKNNIKTKILSFSNMKGTQVINKSNNKNFLVIKKVFLSKKKNVKFKNLKKNIDIVKITRNHIFYSTNIKEYKNIKLYNFTIIGIDIKYKIIKILFEIKKYFYKNIINSMENKFSFLVKKKKKNKVLKIIKSIFI